MDLRPQPHRFHDGGTETEPPDPERAPRIVLERVLRGSVEEFRMLRRLGYRDSEYGELLVPADLDGFRTDLASVPALFTWLVPKTGNHLPAALLHDGLVATSNPPSYLSTDGHDLDRVAADRVFRDAMRDTHTGTVRRWLVWSAVTLATIWVGSATWSPRTHLRYAVTAAGSLGLIAIIGAVATLDLVDLVDALPWMGDRPWWLELAGGLAAAVVIPLVLGLTWGRFRVAGTIAGIALAVLLHVTAVLATLSVLYRLAERVVAGRPQVAVAVTAGIVSACAALALGLVLAAG